MCCVNCLHRTLSWSIIFGRAKRRQTDRDGERCEDEEMCNVSNVGTDIYKLSSFVNNDQCTSYTQITDNHFTGNALYSLLMPRYGHLFLFLCVRLRNCWGLLRVSANWVVKGAFGRFKAVFSVWIWIKFEIQTVFY